MLEIAARERVRARVPLKIKEASANPLNANLSATSIKRRDYQDYHEARRRAKLAAEVNAVYSARRVFLTRAGTRRKLVNEKDGRRLGERARSLRHDVKSVTVNYYS